MRGEYQVSFVNIVENPRAFGIGDIAWCATVTADSEAEALELGLERLRDRNRELGLPPRSLRAESEARRSARVQLVT